MNAHNFVPWEWHQHTSTVIDMLSSGQYSLESASSLSTTQQMAQLPENKPMPIVALETVNDQHDLYSYRFPSKSDGGFALILGNERHGIEADLLKVLSHHD